MDIGDKLRGGQKKRKSVKKSGTPRERRTERDVAGVRGRGPAPRHVATLSLPASSVQRVRSEPLTFAG